MKDPAQFQGSSLRASHVVAGTVALLLLLNALPLRSLAQNKQRAAGTKPEPDMTNVQYGPHPRNVLDFWKANSDRPTPLVVYIHGGGFRAGDKSSLSADFLKGCLKEGISVMAVNYRLSPEVHFPAHYQDCARAIQFARQHAKEWNIDSKRVGASGGSAGAGTSLWLGFHDDLADPKSPDPVLRESTRLSCMMVQGAQTSYDPRVIREWIGEATSKHPALAGFYGLKPDELDSPRAFKLYEEASPINFLTADDPPVMLVYNEANQPVAADAPPGTGIHHPRFGDKLKERMDKLKIECVLKQREDYRGTQANMNHDAVKFMVKHLQPASAGK